MWRSVELREIRVFLAVAEELHFGRAASRVGISQSRAAQNFQDLERKLGVQLAHRTSKWMTLTPAGEELRNRAGAALADLEGVLRATEENSLTISGPVRIGVVSAAAVSPRLRHLVSSYEAAYPESKVVYVGLPFVDRFGPIRRREVELMVSTLPLYQAGLATGHLVSKEPRMLAVGKHHPLAGRGEVDVEELADHAIGSLDILAPRELTEEMAPRTTPGGRRIPCIRADADEPSTLLIAVAGGEIVQPVSNTFAETYRHPDVVFVPLRGLPETRSVLVWRKRDRHPGLRAFLHVATRSKPHSARRS